MVNIKSLKSYFKFVLKNKHNCLGKPFLGKLVHEYWRIVDAHDLGEKSFSNENRTFF